jgi:hypothetical protein
LTIEGDQYIYDGEWLNDQKTGVGMEVCKSGGKYTGMWVKDMKSGEGVSVSIEGDIYTGGFLGG